MAGEDVTAVEGLPFFGDFEKLFGSGSKDHWSTAKQIAVQMASGEDGDPNVDPSDRIALEELSRIALKNIVCNGGLLAYPAGSLHILGPANIADVTIKNDWSFDQGWVQCQQVFGGQQPIWVGQITPCC